MSLDTIDRRDFVALSAAVGLTAAGSATADAADAQVTSTDVNIKTRDGNCDAAFFHPATGTHPAVIVWTDIFGLRPVFRDMGKRLAAQGYSVLVPNPFYRTQKAPLAFGPANFNFGSNDDRAKLPPLTNPLNAAGAAESDAQAFVAWLDSQSSVNKSKKIGTQGYCMGGPLVLRTAAAMPARIGAVGSFHGGGLVTQAPDSPHTMIPKMKAQFLIAIAQNDDKQQPDAKDVLKKAFADNKLKAEVEVYPAQHGWCVPDFNQPPTPIYNQAEAERAWSNLLKLYKAALV